MISPAAALEEIAKGEGAYNHDPLIHAGNTLDNMKALARAAIPVAEMLEKTLERIRDHSVGTTADGPCIECEHMIEDARDALK